MDFSLDRASGTPIRRQIRGTIEYAIACGDLAIGAALPSVRDLAEQLGVAPMTITQVYNDLKRDGVVEARSGSGTYVADSAQAQMATRPDIDSLHREIDRLIDLSESIGVKTSDLSSLVSHRVAYRASMGRRYSVVMAGLFAEATRSYARHIAMQLGEDATVRPVTIEALQHSLDIKAWVSAADLVITFPNLLPQVAEMFPATSVTSLRFIPSEETRLSLASLDPRTRLGVVSKFADFLPIIRSGVQRFAPHVEDVVAVNEAAPDLAPLMADRDVIVFATGVSLPTEMLSAKSKSFEYRHIPDPGDIDRVVRPFIAAAKKT